MFLVRLSLLSIVSTVITATGVGKYRTSKETVSAAVDSLNQGLVANLSNSLPLTARSFHTT
jgi:hypothetical protein